jgi:type I restriction enzyme, S subunit
VSDAIAAQSDAWQVKPLADLAEKIQYGYTAKARSDSDGIRYLRITDIQDDQVDWGTVPSCDVEDAESEKYLLSVGDLVFARTGATVGKSFLLRGSVPRAVFASYLIRVKLRNHIDPRYVAYFFQSPAYWNQIAESSAGIGQPNVNGTKLAQIRIPVAPPKQQQEIVAEIEKQFSRLDEAVANLQRVKANLKRYKAFVLKDAVEGRLVPTEAELARREGRSFETGEQLLQRVLETRRSHWKSKGKYKEPALLETTSLKQLPEGWVWAAVEMVCEQIVDCPHSTARFQDDGFPCIDTTWMTTEGLVTERARYVDQATYQDRISRLEPRTGDIVFAREGTIGTAIMIPEKMTPCLGQRVMLLRASVMFSNGLLMHTLHSEVVKSQYRAQALGSTVAHINVGDVKRFAIPVPPMKEQHRILAEIDRRLSLIRGVEFEVDANLKRAQALRQSTLSSAFQQVR